MIAPYPRAAMAVPSIILLLLLFAGSPLTLRGQSPLLNVEDQAENPLFQVYDNGGLLAVGVFDGGSIPGLGAGVRMTWYPNRAVFRAGQVAGDEWDHENTGDHSVAMGLEPLASGAASISLGERTHATAASAVAMGSETVAEDDGAFAVGIGAHASGHTSIALGRNTAAADDFSVAIGKDAQATGRYAVAVGGADTGGPTASGLGSMALGPLATASGTGSTAFGIALATGQFATAFGAFTVAQSYGSLVLGQFNVASGSTTQNVSTDPLLVAGNGTGHINRSNALTLLKNGDVTIAGTLTESSDIRLKVGVEPIEEALARVLRLTPIRYRYRPGTGHPAGPQIGLSAQEVREVFPELVSEDSQGYLSVAYTDLAAVLVGAVREQQAAFEAQAAEISRLRQEMAELRRLVVRSLGRPLVAPGTPAELEDREGGSR